VSSDAILRILANLSHWAYTNHTVLYPIGAAAVGFVLGRRSVFRYRRRTYENHGHQTGNYQDVRFGDSEGADPGYQNYGEAMVSRTLQQHFGPPDYHLMNHVTLRLDDGTTQVDHILVSRFGVFVLEAKDYKGWIFGQAEQANWTQVLFEQRFQFQNPIHQNARHLRAVRQLLDFIPSDAVRSIVVFTGDAEFKTVMPESVVQISGLVDHVRGRAAEVMSLNRMHYCVGRLEAARLAISGRTDVEHIQSLELRHGRWRRALGAPDSEGPPMAVWRRRGRWI
jgi:hypothetical protein